MAGMEQSGPSAYPGGTTERAEWAAMWPLPLVGMLGVVTCSAFTYSSGVFMGAMTQEFGWTRAQFASAFTLQMLAGVVIGPIVGRLVDRFGPRRIALIGMGTFLLGMSAPAFANGQLWQWQALLLWKGLGIAALAPPVWLAAIVSRFNASRGLALGVVLAGTGVGTALWPLAAVGAIQLVGWRLAFPLMAVCSIAVLLPLTWRVFYGARDLPAATREGAAARQPRPPLWPTIRTRTFACLLIAGCLYASVTLGVTLHLVPILTGNGFSLTLAAAAAGLAGATTLLGRLVTGFALDRLPTRIVGLVAFTLPIVEMLCLWQGDGSLALSLAGVALLGFASGAESDVLVYLASRRFPRAVFASAYAIFGAAFAIAASLGPLLAGAVFDADGSYDRYFLLAIPISALSALLIALVPTPLRDEVRP